MKNSKSKILAIFVLIASVVMMNSIAQAAVRSIPIDEAFLKADFIIQGIVRDSQSRWDERGIMIFTDYTIEVLENIKGHSPSQIVMSFAGGKVGNKSILVTDVPILKIGEEYIICGYDKEKRYGVPVAGGYQGIFRVIRDEISSAEFVVDYNGYQLELTDDQKILKGLPVRKESNGSVKTVEEVDLRKKEIPVRPIDRDADGNIITPEKREYAKPKARERGRAIMKAEFIEYIRKIVP